MGFWFFGKKEDKKAHERIDNIHKILKSSFENVRKDIGKLDDLQSFLHNSHKEYNNKLNEVSLRIEKIEAQFNSLLDKELVPELKVDPRDKIIENNEDLNGVLDFLTFTQINMFVKIYQLQKQLGSRVSYKSIANILYNDKEYAEIRSTLSEYISLLEEHGLVE